MLIEQAMAWINIDGNKNDKQKIAEYLMDECVRMEDYCLFFQLCFTATIFNKSNATLRTYIKGKYSYNMEITPHKELRPINAKRNDSNIHSERR